MNGNRIVHTVLEYLEIIQEITSEKRMAEQQIEKLKNTIFNYPTLNDYIQNIVDVLDNTNVRNEASEFQFYYRGQYKTSYRLLPSALRDASWDKEDFYYHEIMVRCPNYFQNSTHLEKLVTMQHYDCPTRLLDITSNPLVALYFACKNFGCSKCEGSNEGQVLIFPVRTSDVVYSDSDRALMLSCLPRFNTREKEQLNLCAQAGLSTGKFSQVKGGSRYKEDIVERFFHEITTEMPSFKRDISPIDILRPLFVQPNQSNGRIVKQGGAFIISGLSESWMIAEAKLKAIQHATISVVNQSGILSELEHLGIHEASLFPEVDKVAEYLKSK